MQYPALILAATAASAAVLPRIPPSSTWQITNFAVGSGPGENTNYQLDVTNDYDSGSCTATSSVASNDCPGADQPVAFNETTCGNGDSHWSFELDYNNGGLESSQSSTGFSLKITYQLPDSDPIYGCHFLDYKTQCTPDPNNPSVASESLVAPSAFNITAQTSSECVYG